MYASCIVVIPSIPDVITVEFALKKHFLEDKGGHAGCREELKIPQVLSRAENQSIHDA